LIISKHIKIWVLFFFCLSVFSGICQVSANAGNVFKTGYVCRDLKGHLRWQAETEIKNKQGDIYIMTEKAKGGYFGFKNMASWVAEMEFESNADVVRPLKMEKRVMDKNGNILAIEKQQFDFTDNIVTCSHEDFVKNISSTKQFKFKKDIVNRLILGLYIQKLIENGKTREDVQVVTEEPGFYNVKIKILDEEYIEVNGTEKLAYKICLDPKLGILGFVKIFLPKAYVWHSAESEFEWLRYKGLEGSIKSPKVTITTRD